jgi:chorismate mutase/prephenate dehydratase
VERVAMIKPELYICDMVSKDKVTTVDNFEEIGALLEENRVDAGIGILEDVSVQAADEIHSMLVNRHLFINQCKVVNDAGLRKKVVLFTKQLVVKPEHNRMKVMFVCRNKSGSLASILSMISDYGVNLTEIHSKPNCETEWNYEFFLEFDGNFLKKEIQALVFQLMNETQYFQILGSYACEGDF